MTPTGAIPPAVMPECHLAQLDAIDQTYWWHRVRWRIVRNVLLGSHRQRFETYADVGSGGGGLPGLLTRDFQFGRILLFDTHITPVVKIPHPAVEQHVVDLEAFDPAGVPALDLITCLDTLEHLRNPEELLRSLALLAKPESLLIVTLPALPALWSYWDELAHHHRRYTRATLRQLLTSSGWDVDMCRYAFHAAVVPLWFRRRANPDGRRLEFPTVPSWANTILERAFWAEYLLCGGVPCGSSVVAVAHPTRRAQPVG